MTVNRECTSPTAEEINETLHGTICIYYIKVTAIYVSKILRRSHLHIDKMITFLSGLYPRSQLS